MITIFFQTIPFFALIGCGYLAARTRFFPPEAAALLTKFVFYFALSAMLFRLAATLPFDTIWQPRFLIAYLCACVLLYLVVLGVSYARQRQFAISAFEAQTTVIGNTGFIALPMFVSMFGAQAAAPILMMLAVDLIVFGGLIVAIVEAERGGRSGLAAFATAIRGMFKNPMFVSVILGILWSRAGLPWPQPLDDFTRILGAAATPCALFAIGCTLTQQSADERLGTAVILSALKLVVHPALVAVLVLFVFDIEPFVAAMAIAGSAMPTAGNIYIIAQTYGIAVHRVSATILISTVASVVTVTIVLGLLGL